MKISCLLKPETILTELRADTREEAIRRLVSLLGQSGKIDGEAALKDIAARERLGSTLIPTETGCLAIPHAHSSACKQLVISVGLAPAGVAWESGGKRADLVMLILYPPQAQSLYLRILSRIAHLFEGTNFLDLLRQTPSAQEIIDRIEEAERPFGEFAAGEGLPSFCILGAGHGGLAMAAHLALNGCRVNLYNRTEAKIEPIRARGGILADGEIKGFASLNLISSDPAEAINDCDILMVVVPALAHRDMAQAIAPHLKDGQIVVLNPGRTGGALEFRKILREKHPHVHPYIAEAQTLLYAARAINPGQVHVFGIKNTVPLASLPAYHIIEILPVIRKALPQFVPGDNVLKTSLENIGAVFHPAITVLNAGRIEDTHGDFQYYVEGVTPAVAKILEAIDQERVAVAAALGVRVNTAREWLYLAYDAAGKTLHDAIKANAGYAGIKAPGTIEHRYIAEDVPMSLVPIASIGEMLGVATPAIRSIIQMAALMHGVDYWAQGRTVERLGIAGKSVKDIRFLVVGAESRPAPKPTNIPVALSE